MALTLDWSDDEAATLAEHRLRRTGMQVKLDRGFEPGVYGICIEFDRLASQIGFTAARRQALAYGAVLRSQLGSAAGYVLGDAEDASRVGGPGQKFDLDSTFLLFDLATDDGSWRDADMTEQFRLALLRADQHWDQAQAGLDERRRDGRRERFRQRLATLLEGEAYRQVDAATKERLLAEVTAMAFPPKGREL